MLESFRKGQRWLTLIFVASIGIVFVFFLGVGGSFGPQAPTGNAIVELGEIQLTSRDFSREQRATEDRLRQQLGDAYDQVGAERYVDGQALSSMINTVVLATAAKDLGLHVTTDEVRRVVQAIPSFIDQEGKFSPAAFNNYAESEYGTQRSFIRSFTRSLLGQKIIQLIAAQTTVSDSEIDLMTHYELDEVRIAYVSLDGSILPEGETVSDEDIEAWATENEDELRAIFNERAPSLAIPEQVRARHILIRAPSDAEATAVEAARERALAALTRLQGGEDFAAVAAEVSEDVGTAASGGDLGLFERGGNDPALDEAAFALEVGALSEVVRSDYGFHIVRVDGRVEAQPATWADSRLSLAREGATAARALERAAERAQSLVDTIEQGGQLEDAARIAGLTLERPPAIKRRPDGFVTGLGAAEDLMTAAFTLSEGQSSPDVFEVGGQRVLIQVIERNIADPATVEAARADRRAQTLAAKQNQAIEAWLTDYRRQLESSGRLRINAELALGTS